MNNTKKVIRDFLGELDGRIIKVEDDQSLLEEGIIDSLKMVELLSFIEGRYGVFVDDDELIPENFETLNAMVNFLEQKTGMTQK
ncbi:acyl carrier protein [Candidatus Poribacteria bacterium]|nr:acyl carrier protein [Candidatus Poribacteria bacterium]